MAQFLAGNRGKLAGYVTADFPDIHAPTGRSVTEYTLNLTEAEAGRLDSLLRAKEGRMLERFNMRTANCTTVLFDLIDSAVAPATVSPGTAPVFSLPAARFYTDTLRRAAPWVTALITHTLGTDADGPIDGARSVSPLIFDDNYRSFVIGGDSSSRPLVAAVKAVRPQMIATTPPAVTPTGVATVITLLLAIISIMSVTGKCERIVAAADRAFFFIIFLAGSLVAFAILTPYRMGAPTAWTLTVLNPLIIFLPALYRRSRLTYRIVAWSWAAWLAVFAVTGGLITAEALPYLRILAAGIALRVATYRES